MLERDKWIKELAMNDFGYNPLIKQKKVTKAEEEKETAEMT
jgi:hypothetical protein